MIENNVKNILKEIPERNAFGEKITLVAAVKLQSAEDINRAIKAGITDIGDNHVQEFRDKYEFIQGEPRRHFIGHLQTNKVKYLMGKVHLYHSADRLAVAEELSKRGEAAGISSDILIQINIGGELSKGGFEYGEAERAYELINKMPALRVKGLMAMLPLTDDVALLSELARKMRALYDAFKKYDGNFEYLSMGMSGDWKLCVEAGSNMLRLGTSIFGARNYN